MVYAVGDGGVDNLTHAGTFVAGVVVGAIIVLALLRIVLRDRREE